MIRLEQYVHDLDHQERELWAHVIRKHWFPNYVTFPDSVCSFVKGVGKVNGDSTLLATELPYIGLQRSSPVRRMSWKKSSPWEKEQCFKRTQNTTGRRGCWKKGISNNQVFTCRLTATIHEITPHSLSKGVSSVFSPKKQMYIKPLRKIKFSVIKVYTQP